MTALRTVAATRYVTPLREGGSLPAMVEADDVDLGQVRLHLASIPAICLGGTEAGPIGRLSRRERFHWLVAPRSTTIQLSPVHTGRCDDPRAALEHLLATSVRFSGTA